MDVYEFAGKYLQPYKVKGDEIIPTLCPLCDGGAHHDKYTFALNVQKLTYNCRRGSCSEKGTFTELLRRFGEVPDAKLYKTYNTPRKARKTRPEPFKLNKQYKRPQGKDFPLTDAVIAYMESRKISRETLEKSRASSDENGNIKFNFYDERGERVFTKYRPSHKVDKNSGERKSWRDKETKPILYLMNLCDTAKPLIITEGEIDALSLIECGIENAVSVPSGAQDLTFLDTCYEWLEKFDEIILFGDADEAGRGLVRELANRLGEYRVAVVPDEAYKGCKDANELLFRYGKEAVVEAVNSAARVPVAGLLSLADIKPFDFWAAERVSAGIEPLNRLLGGFWMGQLTVWSGRRGEGKSTILGQMLLESIENGFNVCAYSGELTASQFQYWLDLQAAGEDNITFVKDPLSGEKTSVLTDAVKNGIHEWYRGKAYLYDNEIAGASEADAVMSVFEYAARRYNCRVFTVDNLMSLRYEDSDNFYRRQSLFCGRLAEFAKKYNVHVHLVAHPRKTTDRLGNDDIAGSADITNRADNVITMTKIPDEKFAELKCNTSLEVTKNRFNGKRGAIGLNFSAADRRYFFAGSCNNRVYSWNKPWEKYDEKNSYQRKV